MAIPMNTEDIMVTPMDMADTLAALAALYRVKLAKEMLQKASRHCSWPSFARPEPPEGPNGLPHGHGGHPGEVGEGVGGVQGAEVHVRGCPVGQKVQYNHSSSTPLHCRGGAK